MQFEYMISEDHGVSCLCDTLQPSFNRRKGLCELGLDNCSAFNSCLYVPELLHCITFSLD